MSPNRTKLELKQHRFLLYANSVKTPNRTKLELKRVLAFYDPCAGVPPNRTKLELKLLLMHKTLIVIRLPIAPSWN